jgi:Cupin-like domain
MPDTSLLEIDDAMFRAYFDSKPFQIRHQLAGSALFGIPRLVELAQKLPGQFVEYNGGNLPVGAKPEETPRTGLSAAETLRRIEECGSWLVLKRVEQDPEYGALLDRCLDEVGARLPKRMLRRQGFIFVSSPGSVTPLHMDPEHNFLLQIRGTKTVSMWDPTDRFVISEKDLETFHSSFKHRNLPWRETFQQTAYKLSLEPGQGLHFPVTVPHWVQNGPQVSVSFSITFRTPSSERREMLYRANARLRQLGISPTPPGQSPLLDSTKHAMFSAASRLKALLRS